MIIGGNMVMFGGMHTYDTFEGLDDTVKRLNTKLAEDPIPGKLWNQLQKKLDYKTNL